MSKSYTAIVDSVIGILFWVLVVGAIVYFVVRENHGKILLDVSTQPEMVSGVVVFEGVPVHEGTLHVVVSEARNRRYQAGMTLPVKNGKFSSQGRPRLGLADSSRPWRITAEFHGRAIEKTGGEQKSKVVSGETTRYLNTSPPLGERFLWSLTIAMLALLFFQLVLFTGDLGQRKARLLFVLMYFFTFFSLALPVVVSLLVARYENLVHSMEISPIGLVKAKAFGSDGQQWLVNIGGNVRRSPPATAGGPEAQASPVEEGSRETGLPALPAAADTSSVPSERPDRTVASEAEESPGDGAAAPSSATAGVVEEAGEVVRTVEGGVAVPLYVVLLAMFGAGINMTLKVPVIQRSYEDVLVEDGASWFNSLAAPWKLLRGNADASMIPRKTAGDIRRDLIENFMYLLSAPLLAIAMYYLLQVLAAEVTQPVLVLMAFATGLVSKAVVGGIIQFAESKLLNGRTPEADPSELNKAVVKAEAKQDEAETAERAWQEARVELAAAEAAASVAEDVAKKASESTPEGSEVIQQVSEEIAREAAAKRAEATEAQKAVDRAERRVKETQEEARKALSAAEQARLRKIEAAANAARQAEAKQAEARDAAEATEQAAKEATAKQAAAQEAVNAVVQPQQGSVEAEGQR